MHTYVLCVLYDLFILHIVYRMIFSDGRARPWAGRDRSIPHGHTPIPDIGPWRFVGIRIFKLYTHIYVIPGTSLFIHVHMHTYPHYGKIKWIPCRMATFSFIDRGLDQRRHQSSAHSLSVSRIRKRPGQAAR